MVKIIRERYRDYTKNHDLKSGAKPCASAFDGYWLAGWKEGNRGEFGLYTREEDIPSDNELLKNYED